MTEAEAEALRTLRALAVDRGLGLHPGSDQLIRFGLDALLAGVDSPSLPLLAGLGRNEEPQALDLFDQVLDELGLAYPRPVGATFAADRRALADWLAARIVEGVLEPARGADLIREVAVELGHPEALAPMVRWALTWDVRDEEWDYTHEELSEGVVLAARDLLTHRPSENG
ncbi:hypothetical protein OG455_35405 [Kitasatospora sp. NBC_01287]|uniref:hypothetical protein n=1 Tax=Kitasatospora sp. NBC_01287 TaxID=2903573 RepID=UPI002251BF40|nr:hypothetical protein [Kitasatospora sp. NBC_01287]MCX4750734.1 hypothetical protein [Kitasatospora sp. NBC_01287]